MLPGTLQPAANATPRLARRAAGRWSHSRSCAEPIIGQLPQCPLGVFEEAHSFFFESGALGWRHVARQGAADNEFCPWKILAIDAIQLGEVTVCRESVRVE